MRKNNIELEKFNMKLFVVSIVFLCSFATNSLAVYGIPAINLAHANKLEKIGRYAQAAQERELTVWFYKYLSIPQFEDDREFFLSKGNTQKAKSCENTIAGFEKSMKECQEKLEENLAKANLTKDQIDKYQVRNRIRLLASAKLYPVMHNGQIGVDLGELEKHGEFSADFEKAAEGRERSARLYEKLTVNYLVKEAEVLEKEGKADFAENYRILAQEFREKAKQNYTIAEKHRSKAESLKKFDDTKYLVSALEDQEHTVRLLAVEKAARDLNYLVLLKASQSNDHSVKQKADEILKKNEKLFKSISPIALVNALASEERTVRQIAISKLEELANTKLGYDADADESNLKISIASWKEWLSEKLKPGLVGIYYRKKSFEDEALSRVDKKIKFNWKGSPDKDLPKDNFSVRWIGKIKILHDGKYTLSFKNDDKVKVWLGKTLDTMDLIATDWSEYDYDGYKTELELEKGFYDIRIDFLENSREAYIKFFWEAEGVSKGVVPPENLFHIDDRL